MCISNVLLRPLRVVYLLIFSKANMAYRWRIFKRHNCIPSLIVIHSYIVWENGLYLATDYSLLLNTNHLQPVKCLSVESSFPGLPELSCWTSSNFYCEVCSYSHSTIYCWYLLVTRCITPVLTWSSWEMLKIYSRLVFFDIIVGMWGL